MAMSGTRRLFKYVVWAGVAANWAFGIWAIFGDPDTLLARFRLGEQQSHIWLYNYSVLLMILSLFYLPAATNPFRYRANAWLLIVGRLVPASTFLFGVITGFMPKGFLILMAGDSTFGLVELVLLVKLLRQGPEPQDLKVEE
jgi:hypothetical protein